MLQRLRKMAFFAVMACLVIAFEPRFLPSVVHGFVITKNYRYHDVDSMSRRATTRSNGRDVVHSAYQQHQQQQDRNQERHGHFSMTALFAVDLKEKQKVYEVAPSELNGLVGDDSAYFSLEEQSLDKWIKFSVATGTVLAFVAWVWVLPDGPLLGDVFLNTIQDITGTRDPAVTVFSMLAAFAVAHSGLAALRTYAEPIVGARAWRVVFAVVSLPLALSCVSYFVNHAHEGIHLWDATGIPGIHTALWIANFISFLLLYPSTFNLLEIAAIEQPQLHLWETGIIRITRHPQAVGQAIWCIAHSIWLGTSTALAASAMLILHHGYSVWHGDRRLKTRHGEAFDYIKSKTSILPFQAILEGRQELPPDYYRELLRAPYLIVVAGTIGAYFAHPWMQAGAAALHW